jgi:fructosamine-3-kinase
MMWQEISDRISQITAEQFEVIHCSSVSGGSINQAYLVTDDRRKFFVKTNGAEKVAMFEAEAIALSQIGATKTMRVPQPVCWGVADRIAYIVMEWIELGHKQDWNLFGTSLAAMHRVTNHKFGWQQQNTIGSTPQINTWNQDWVEFFGEQRLGYQLQLAQRKGFSSSVPTEKLLEAVPRFFRNYNPQPSMVHGDLWGGNAGFSDQGEPIIYDPALYFGDREVDIAITELFGGFPAQFYQAYDLAFPLDPGYKQRKTLYNLYHILNHFNLFGGGYGSQANRMIASIIQLSKT